MLQSKLIGDTKQEWPSEASIKSHGLLLKGGYIKQMATGIYTLMPLGKKVASKICNLSFFDYISELANTDCYSYDAA